MPRSQIKKVPHSQRFTALSTQVSQDVLLTVEEALAKVKATATAKYVESVDMAVNLGIDTRKSDQNVRGLTTIPHGTGKKHIVAVLAKGDLAVEAEKAGADIVGAEDLIAKIVAGEKGFDVLLATEEMAVQLAKISRALGPKTPNKRNGTVTNSISTAVKEIKMATRVEYRADKAGVVHMSLGKVNFTDEQLIENFKAAFGAVLRAKPPSAKGRYIRTLTLSATMGPAVRVDPTVASKFVV